MRSSAQHVAAGRRHLGSSTALARRVTPSTGLVTGLSTRPGRADHRRMVTVLPLLAALPPVFDLTQAAAVGLSRHVLPRAIRDGVVVRIAGGLFAAAERWSAADRRERHLLQCAAAARQRPWATISHHSAACRHGLPLPRHLPPWVAMSTGRALTTANPGGLVRLEPGALPAGHVSQLHGIRLTTPARTVIDCLRCLGLADGVAMADAALRAGMTTGDELVGMRRDQRRWPNITQADLGLTLLDPARRTGLSRRPSSGSGLEAFRFPSPRCPCSRSTARSWDAWMRCGERGLWRWRSTVGASTWVSSTTSRSRARRPRVPCWPRSSGRIGCEERG